MTDLSQLLAQSIPLILLFFVACSLGYFRGHYYGCRETERGGLKVSVKICKMKGGEW